MPEWAVPETASLGSVTALELAANEEDDAGYGWTVTGTMVNGYELEDLIQSDQYYDDTYWAFGEIIGMYESNSDNIYIDHPGFEDVFGSDRVTNCTWSGGSCTSSAPDPGGSHATATASVLVGDITAAQDATETPLSGTNWRERSGVARMAEVVGASSLSYFSSASFDGALVNRSSSTSGDPDCDGACTACVTWNGLYEGGLGLFKSAGNDGHGGDTDDCRVGPPGAAMGSFTVAAYLVNDDDDEAIYNNDDDHGSSRGGTAVDGRGRSIIALAAPSGIQYPYPYSDSLLASMRYGTDWAGDGGSPDSFCCTSAATPVAAGAGALFREWYYANVDSSIDDPGILYANMLLMGDRTQEGTSTRMTEGYDGLWGAGKLRLRMFDLQGMDKPWAWGDGTACVDDGAYTFVTIASSPLDSDVDVLRVVAWWYDRRHDDSTTSTVDSVSMEVRRYDSWIVPVVPGSGTVVADDAGTDNKLRVHVANPTSGKYYRVRFSGDDVTSDGEGCGTDSMRVYYAWFYEDSDREAAEALPYIRPE